MTGSMLVRAGGTAWPRGQGRFLDTGFVSVELFAAADTWQVEAGSAHQGMINLRPYFSRGTIHAPHLESVPLTCMVTIMREMMSSAITLYPVWPPPCTLSPVRPRAPKQKRGSRQCKQ